MVKDLLFFLLAFSVGSAKKSLNLVSFSHSCYVKRERERENQLTNAYSKTQYQVLFSNSPFPKTNNKFLPNLILIGYFRDINNISLLTQRGKFISQISEVCCRWKSLGEKNMKYENYLLLFTPCTIQHHNINCLLVGSEADTYLHRFKVLLHRVQGLLLASS